MKDNTKVFEEYTVPKAVMTMALPSMLSMLINIVYNLADTFFVGQTGDSNQVAAVSVSMPLFLLFIATGNLFGVGGCAFVSRSLGEGRKDRVKTISSFCIYASIAVGLVLGIIFFTLKNQILMLVGASENTLGLAADYLKWVALGAPSIVLSMIGSVIGQITNIILDPIFILHTGDKLFGINMPFGFDMGVAGAAIATVIGNIVSVIYFLIYFLRGKSILSISPKRFAMGHGITKGVIGVGLPAAINSLLMSISNIIVNVVLIKYGDSAVAAMGIAMKANMLVVMLQIGLGQGVQPLVGYCYGAQNYKRMRKCLRFSIICNIIIGTAMTGFYLLFRRNVIELFINDAQVIDLGVKMLLALMASGPVIGIMFVLNFSFQGMGKGIQSMILSLGRQGLIYVPMLFIMNKLIGLEGIIWSQATADICCVIMSIIMFMFINKGIKKKESSLA